MCNYVDQKVLAAMLDVERLAGVTPEANLRNSFHTDRETRKQRIYPGFEIQGRCHQKSKDCPLKLKKDLASNLSIVVEFNSYWSQLNRTWLTDCVPLGLLTLSLPDLLPHNYARENRLLNVR